MPLSLGTFLPMRRAASPPRVGAPGRPATGADAGARRGLGGDGRTGLSLRPAFLSAAVAASTETGELLGARLANCVGEQEGKRKDGKGRSEGDKEREADGYIRQPFWLAMKGGLESSPWSCCDC